MEYLTTAEVAERLDMKKNTVLCRINVGTIPAKRDDGRWYIPAAWVEAYLAARPENFLEATV